MICADREFAGQRAFDQGELATFLTRRSRVATASSAAAHQRAKVCARMCAPTTNIGLAVYSIWVGHEVLGVLNCFNKKGRRGIGS